MMKSSKIRRILLSLAVAMFVVFGLGMSNAFAQEQGTVTMSVEKATLGQGYLIAPTKVAVNDGETVEAVTKRFLDSTVGAGNYALENGYLSAIKDDSMKGEVTDVDINKVPQYIKDAATVYDRPITTKANTPGMLSAGDFNAWGGFSYRVNSVWGQGMNTDTVKNGDVVRIAYTVVGAGSEWAVTGWEDGKYQWPKYADRIALISTIAHAAELELQSSEQYQAAVATATALPGDQNAVYTATLNLQALIDGSEPGEYPLSTVVDVEKFTMGQGFLVEPTVVPAKDGETATDVIKRYLDQAVGTNGYKYSTNYLSGIRDASMKGQDGDLDLDKVPSYIKDRIAKDGQTLRTKTNEDGWLQGGDFHDYAGFTYCVNDTSQGNKGIDEYEVQDNDVIRIGFSLWDMGNDWFKNFTPYWDQNYAAKSMAVAAIAAANKYGVTGDNLVALKEETAKLPGDQNAVDAAGKKVMEDVTATMPGKLLGNAKGQGYNYKPQGEANKVYGTTGEGKKLTGLKFNVDGNDNLGVSYEAHVANVGWMPAVADGAEAGQGDNAIEAVRIKLTGADADKYDVFYRAHVAYVGWMQWTKNGEMAGTQGFGLSAEAVEAYIAPKGFTFNHNEFAYKDPSQVAKTGSGQGHIQNIGDGQGFVRFNQRNAALIGTTGQSLRMEGITLKDEDPDLNITYNVHCQNVGWTGFKNEGEFAGTRGNGWRMEAIQVKLDGPNAAKYDIEYRAHVQNIGWTDWVKNGETAGTEGRSLRLEAVEIRFVEKQAADNPLV